MASASSLCLSLSSCDGSAASCGREKTTLSKRADSARLLLGDTGEGTSATRMWRSSIAFYGGHSLERGVLQQAYDDLVKHINYIYRKKIWYTMLEQVSSSKQTNTSSNAAMTTREK